MLRVIDENMAVAASQDHLNVWPAGADLPAEFNDFGSALDVPPASFEA